jgi:hypothetical protein
LVDVFLPKTDVAVLVQVVLTIVIGVPVVVAMYRRRLGELVWFFGGLVVLLLGLFAYRSVH